MYIAGRLRTASRPLRTWIESALYCSLGGVMSPGSEVACTRGNVGTRERSHVRPFARSSPSAARLPDDAPDPPSALAQPREDHGRLHRELLRPGGGGHAHEQG